MKREEIEELKGLAASMGLYDDKNPCKRAVILGKAIKVLEHEPREDATLKDIFCMGCEYKEQETCEDAISRQAVIEAIEDDNRNGLYSCFASDNDAQCFKDVIRKLPPVNPQDPILDKIKAEIKQLPYQRIFGNVSSYSLLDAVIEIIDKYKAESEEVE